jgi:PEP-CTERM motif
MFKKKLFACTAAALLFIPVGTANAAIEIYYTQASYLAAISAPGVDNFDNLDPTQPLDTPQNRTAGTYSYTVSVGPSSNFFPAGTLGGDVWLSGDDPTDTVTFDNFSPGVRGLGGYFFRTNLQGQLTDVDATINFLAIDASGSISKPLVNPTISSFLGFVSTGALTSVQLWVGVAGVGVPDLFVSTNDVTLGVAAPIPEPETYALMLGGLALLTIAVRRRSSTELR